MITATTDVGFPLVSDASGRSVTERYRPGVHSILRILTGILMPQMRSLRARSFLTQIIQFDEPGSLLQIVHTCERVLRGAGRQFDERLCSGCLPESTVQAIAKTPTDIRRMSQADFDLLFRHGFEVADYTLYADNPSAFEYIGYGSLHWG